MIDGGQMEGKQKVLDSCSRVSEYGTTETVFFSTPVGEKDKPSSGATSDA